MSNSPLVSYTQISPNKNSPRNHTIDTITIHCYVAQASVEDMGDWFSRQDAECSSNYGIGEDGRVGMFVEESDRSWCSSSKSNDHRAVTIECASDDFHPYAVKDAVWNKLLDLCTDICERNEKDTLIWLGDYTDTMDYYEEIQPNEMVMTVHMWFANKECPGEYLLSRMGTIAEQVTSK